MIWNRYIKFGNVYGVLDGQYKGHTLIYIEKRGDLYGFCDMFNEKITNRWIAKKDFEFAVKYGIIEQVINPPPTNEIKEVAKAQFRQNEARV